MCFQVEVLTKIKKTGPTLENTQTIIQKKVKGSSTKYVTQLGGEGGLSEALLCRYDEERGVNASVT